MRCFRKPNPKTELRFEFESERMGRRKAGSFVPLRDVQNYHRGTKVNIIAVILDIGFPKRTHGPDFCCPIRVIDETHHEMAMAVNLFGNPVQRLPRIAAAGDIIQFCPVMIGKAEDWEVNASFNVAWYTGCFALYKGEDDDDDIVPYHASSNFHPTNEDKRSVDKLRKWLVNFQFDGDSSDYPMLREIRQGFFNLACKILHYWKAENGDQFIFVWDGTDTPPNAICAMLEDEVNFPLHLQLKDFPLQRELFYNLPTVGSILGLKLDPAIQGNEFDFLNPGKWVKLHNIKFEVDAHAGLWQGVLTTHSKLRYAQNERLIVERRRLSLERNISEFGRIPYWIPESLCITEVVNNEDAEYGTLMDVLSHTEVAAKFKCLVRVVAALPWRAGELWSPDGTYRMRLTIEDPTARIYTFVVAEDAVTLFDAMPGNDVDEVARKLDRLLGVTGFNSPRNPPWISVCLKSYSLSETVHNRQFRIFDTKVVDES